MAKCSSNKQKYEGEAQFDSGEYAFGPTKTDAGRYSACCFFILRLVNIHENRVRFPAKMGYQESTKCNMIQT